MSLVDGSVVASGQKTTLRELRHKTKSKTALAAFFQ